MTTPKHKNSCPGGSWNVTRPFLGYHNNILSLSVQCLGVEKKFFKEKIYINIICDFYGHAPAHEINNFGRPFLDHHYYTLILYGSCPGVDKTIFKEIHQFYSFYPKFSDPLGWGPWNLHFLVSLPNKCYRPNLVKIGPIVL